MNSEQKRIRDLAIIMNRFPVPDAPTLGIEDTQKLSIQLIQEEAEEVREAILGKPIYSTDTVIPRIIGRLPPVISEIAKELADLQVVTYWAGTMFGVDMEPVFTEVHRSNESKLVDGKAVFRADGKYLKGPNYTPPDIEKVLLVQDFDAELRRQDREHVGHTKRYPCSQCGGGLCEMYDQ